MSFNPNDTATADSGIFGLPFSTKDAKLVLIPVPWEVTTSYGDGTSLGPQAILEASHQVDLFDIETGDVYRHGYAMLPIPENFMKLNNEMKAKVGTIVEALEAGEEPDHKLQAKVNDASNELNTWVYTQAQDLIKAGKIVAVIGGDHSAPIGAIRAISESVKGDFGILHVDAHADLRDAYQGFTHSHASIMHNVMAGSFAPKNLVQVGIRDFSMDEYSSIKKSGGKITTFFDPLLKRRLNRGDTWQKICDEIISKLPSNVYVSFDIDGLMPDLCPNTGTPVPGGLSFDQAATLLATIVEHGKRIIGFDLCEVAQPEGSESEWDGNVGARLLFKMCGWTMISNGHKASEF